LELRQYLRILKKWLWLIAVGALLSGAVALGVSLALPPVYRASTTLLVRTTGGEGDDYGTVIVNQYLAATYSELITKRPIVETAVRNLDLDVSGVDEWMSQIEVWVVPGTSVLRLEVRGPDPRQTMALTNELVAVFTESHYGSRTRRNQELLVAEPATLPREPVAPRVLFNTLIAALGGGVLALGAVLLIEYLDDSPSTPEEVDQALSVPTLGAIPSARRLGRRDRTPITLASPASSVTEAYHALRTRIQFSHLESPDSPSVLLVTSPSSWKEKADVTVNLGVALAQANCKTLLVDADLRRPDLHHVFGFTNESGLTSILAGDMDLERYIHTTDIHNLSVLCSGPFSSESAALLSSSHMREIIVALGKRADIVLFDAPPVLTVSDTMALASQVDGTVLSIQSHMTSHTAAARALQRLASVQARVFGVVLNGATGTQYAPRSNGHRGQGDVCI
jgi:capsular exopolysaccharide synthesis family protein